MGLHGNTIALLVIGSIMTVSMWLASGNAAATSVIAITTIAGAAFAQWARSRH